jgi:hypothetical protein
MRRPSLVTRVLRSLTRARHGVVPRLQRVRPADRQPLSRRRPDDGVRVRGTAIGSAGGHQRILGQCPAPDRGASDGTSCGCASCTAPAPTGFAVAAPAQAVTAAARDRRHLAVERRPYPARPAASARCPNGRTCVRARRDRASGLTVASSEPSRSATRRRRIEGFHHNLTTRTCACPATLVGSTRRRLARITTHHYADNIMMGHRSSVVRRRRQRSAIARATLPRGGRGNDSDSDFGKSTGRPLGNGRPIPHAARRARQRARAHPVAEAATPSSPCRARRSNSRERIREPGREL